MSLDTDSQGVIQGIRVTEQSWMMAKCKPQPPNPWRTRSGLLIRESAGRAIQLNGEPDSRSPSTKDGQQLELLYYAFDWAGPDVPQVMEVLCTPEKDGKPGRVVDITLAAPSL